MSAFPLSRLKIWREKIPNTLGRSRTFLASAIIDVDVAAFVQLNCYFQAAARHVQAPAATASLLFAVKAVREAAAMGALHQTHAVDETKRNTLRQNGLATLEIDLSSARELAWDEDELRRTLLEGLAPARWVFHPAAEQVAAETVEASVPLLSAGERGGALAPDACEASEGGIAKDCLSCRFCGTSSGELGMRCFASSGASPRSPGPAGISAQPFRERALEGPSEGSHPASQAPARGKKGTDRESAKAASGMGRNDRLLESLLVGKLRLDPLGGPELLHALPAARGQRSRCGRRHPALLHQRGMPPRRVLRIPGIRRSAPIRSKAASERRSHGSRSW